MQALFNTPIPISLSFDDLIRVTVALEHHKTIFEAAGQTDEANAYEAIINRISAVAQPTIQVMSNGHANSRL